MTTIEHRAWVLGLGLVLLGPTAAPAQAPMTPGAPTLQRLAQSQAAQAAARQDIQAILRYWPPAARAAAQDMIARYGLPDDPAQYTMIWTNAGAWRRIMVVRRETPHDFPVKHSDVLAQTISYRVPLDKVSDVLSFDGSITISRTRGELTSHCQTETMNILALNLVNDIVTGKKTWRQARALFGQSLREAETRPQAPVKFAFPMPTETAADPDGPTP